MGILTYDSRLTATFDDRALAHLQSVMLAKIRRGEQFAFSWVDTAGEYGRTTIWINATIPLTFQYETEETPALNPKWVAALTKQANSAAGLRLLPEPEA